MKIKPGVRILGIQPPIATAMVIVDDAYKKYGAELVITSGTEGRHSPNSLHYCGLAFDARTKNLPSGVDRAGLLELIRTSLGPAFDVIDEGNHLHIELDPKKEF